MTDADLFDPLVQLTWRVYGVLDDVARELGMSTSLVRLLAILRHHEPEMLELARHLGIDKSSASGLVARAEGRGLLERAASPGDRRRVTVRLTGDGRRVADAGEAEVYRRLDDIMAPLPPGDRRRLAGLAAAV